MSEGIALSEQNPPVSDNRDDRADEQNLVPPPEDPKLPHNIIDVIDEFLGPPIAEEQETVYRCPDCDETFDTVGKKNLHYQNKHVRAGQLKDKYCPKCNAGPFTNVHLKRHDTMKHKENDETDIKNGDLPPFSETGDAPDTPTDTDHHPDLSDPDETVEFKGKHSFERKRKDALLRGLEIFPWKKASKEYIVRSWDSIPSIRDDDRDFFDLLNEIGEIEPTQARRLVDIVFSVDDEKHSQSSYTPRYRQPVESEAPSYYGGRRGGGTSDSEYEPRGRPPPRAYDDRYPPSRPEYNERPRYGPPVEDPRAIEERIRMEYEMKEKDREMNAMRKELDQMKEMLERGPPSAPPTRERSEDDEIRAMKKQLAETQKALDRAETERELETIRRQSDAKLARIETEMEASRRYYDEKIQHTSENVSRNPGLSDNAQVALKELETKMTIMQKGMSDFTDLAKTVITAGRPIQAPARSPSGNERDRLRKELGEDAE